MAPASTAPKTPSKAPSQAPAKPSVAPAGPTVAESVNALSAKMDAFFERLMPILERGVRPAAGSTISEEYPAGRRGFASMSEEKRREIQSKGGKASQEAYKHALAEGKEVRRRGRPVGSKNKPRVPVEAVIELINALKSSIPGDIPENETQAVESFLRRFPSFAPPAEEQVQ